MKFTPEQFGAVGNGTIDDTPALQTMLNAAAGASLNVAVGVRIVLTPGRQYRVNGQLTFSPSGINGRFHMFCYGSRIAYGAPAGSRETLSSVTFDATAKTLTRLGGTWALARYPTGRWIDVRGTANVDGQYKVVSGQDTAVLTVQEGFNPHMLANETVKCTIDCSVSCLELGDANHKWFDSVIEGLYMTRVGGVANATNGIKIRNADFFTIRNCTISVADRSLYAAGLLEDGGNNSLTLDTVNMGAGRVCFEGQANVLSIKGATRWQQSQYGMRLFESSVFDIGVIDFSLCTITSVYMKRCGAGRIIVYTESAGSGAVDNDDKLIHFQRCNGIAVSGSLNCARETSKQDVGYGVYLEECDGIRIDAQCNLPGKAILFCDAACYGNELAYTASCKNPEDLTPQRAAVPVIDLSHRLQNNAFARAKTQLPSGLTNYAETDVSAWVVNGTCVRNGTVPNQDETGTVPIFECPTPGNPFTNGAVGLSLTVPDAGGKTLYLRMKVRAVAFREPDANDRIFNKARVEVWLRNNNNFSQVTIDIWRLGFDWDWFEVRSRVPSGAENTEWQHGISARQSGDPIDIAIDAVELKVY